jgi:hypothetical protein
LGLLQFMRWEGDAVKEQAKPVTAAAGVGSNKLHEQRNETEMWSKYVAVYPDADSLKSE